MAVVDSERRVHGVAGRRIADAAIMPTVVSGHTNAATIMIGERGAALVREPRWLAARLCP
jgi:choline dehydrogenase